MTAAAAAIRAQIQGNVVEPYRLPYVRHLVLRVADAGAARGALATMLRPGNGQYGITTAQASHPHAAAGPFVNVGATCLGLRALGVPDRILAGFPPEYRQGMVDRAQLLGDVGTSAPENWVDGLRSPDAVHLMVSVHGQSARDTDDAENWVLATVGRSCAVSARLDGEALVQAAPGPFQLYSDAPDAVRGADAYTHGRGEHFGFRDGISQPHFAGFDEEGREPVPDSQCSPLGILLLGYPNGTPIDPPVPAYPLGYQGAFSAFRVLGQDVAGFRRYVGEEARRLGVDPEVLKAKMCGRRPDGTPLAPAAKDLDDFDFSDDQAGAVCPVGSHIRRANPRAAHIVQRSTAKGRRLVRRGMPFGRWLPEGEEDGPDATPRSRGLLGNFLCASLSSQFEATQFDWLNLGLQDPTITSTNDPLAGANDPETSRFTFAANGTSHTARGIPRFVETMGGAYVFIPSMRALHWLASAGWTA